MTASLINLIKMIELSFKTRKKYDLLVKNSLALSLFWFLTLIVPMMPYGESIPGLREYARYATTGVFLLSFRSILLIFLPLVFGILYMASDEFEERYCYRALKTNDFVEGLQMVSKKFDLKSKELLNLCLVAIGKGVLLIINWVVIYTLMFMGAFIEIWNHLLAKEAKDEFFEIVHFEDENWVTDRAKGLIEGDAHVYRTTRYKSVPLLLIPLLYFGKLFLGDMTFITSKDVDVLVTKSGIGATGYMGKVRTFYKELIDVLLLEGIMCKFPLAIEIEASAKEGNVEYAPLYKEENVPIQDIKWIRIKDLLDYKKVGKE